MNPLLNRAATAGGSAAHRGARRKYLAVRADSRRACAGDAKSGGGSAAEDRRAGACRAGYRRAAVPKDLSGPDPAAVCVPSSAQGQNSWW